MKALRFAELSFFDQIIRQKGYKAIAGVDEAGRGPLAGPVVAAACILPEQDFELNVDDSKKLSARQRFNLFQLLISHPGVSYGIGIVSADEIDKINILQATLAAMSRAVADLPVNKRPDYLLIDGNAALKQADIPNEAVIGGDAKSLSIAAASIIAKETRDRLMLEFHAKWPHYGFDKHKGYGTAKHLDALRNHGPCPIHRLSFAPVRSLA